MNQQFFAVLDDSLEEGDETFVGRLSSDDIILPQETFTVTIQDDDVAGGGDLPQVTVTAPPTNEGLIGLPVTFTLSRPASAQVGFVFDTVAGSANPHEDYLPFLNGLVIFQPGETEKTFFITLVDDAIIEPNDTFTLQLKNPNNLTLPASDPVLTIINDESVFDNYGVQFGFSVEERRILCRWRPRWHWHSSWNTPSISIQPSRRARNMCRV